MASSGRGGSTGQPESPWDGLVSSLHPCVGRLDGVWEGGLLRGSGVVGAAQCARGVGALRHPLPPRPSPYRCGCTTHFFPKKPRSPHFFPEKSWTGSRLTLGMAAWVRPPGAAKLLERGSVFRSPPNESGVRYSLGSASLSYAPRGQSSIRHPRGGVGCLRFRVLLLVYLA